MANNIKERLLININRPIYMAVEHFSELIKLANIDEETRTCHPILMLLDYPSRNGSVYCGADYVNSVEQSIYIQEQLAAGCWFGELTHPPHDCSQDRFITVSHENISHRICTHVVHGNRITGKIQFLPPKGDIVWAWVKTGSNMAFSVRVLTPTYVKKKNEMGQTYIYKYGKMMPVTYDAVFVPGFKEARLYDLNKYNASVESLYGEIVKEMNSTNNKKLLEFKNKYKDEWANIVRSSESYSRESNITYSDLKSLMKSQEKARLLEDVFEFSMEDTKMVLGANNVNIKISPNKTLRIPIDTFLVNSILASQDKLKNLSKD